MNEYGRRDGLMVTRWHEDQNDTGSIPASPIRLTRPSIPWGDCKTRCSTDGCCHTVKFDSCKTYHLLLLYQVILMCSCKTELHGCNFVYMSSVICVLVNCLIVITCKCTAQCVCQAL